MTEADSQEADAGAALLISLLAKVAEGDRAAFEALYQSTCRKLFGIIYRLIGNRERGEELLQDVYIRIWEKAGYYRPTQGAAITWMAAIARNMTIDELRKRSLPVQEDADPEQVSDRAEVSPLRALDSSRRMGRLDDCLSQVSEPQASIIRHAYLDGVSRQTLAELYEQPVGTIKTWLHRSLKQLKLCLGGV